MSDRPLASEEVLEGWSRRSELTTSASRCEGRP
jgi:hypothetical protein